jgi:hypothetical protein
MSFLLSLIFSLLQNWRRGQNRICLEVRQAGRGEWWAGERNGPNNIYTYE